MAEQFYRTQNTKRLFFETWQYYVVFAILFIISIFTISRNIEGEWEYSIEVETTTTIILALAVLPALFRFLVKRNPREHNS